MKQQIHDLLRAAPFRAFVIHMSDGRVFPVEHPDFAMASPHPLAPVIVEDDARLHLLNPRQIASVDLQPAA